MSNSDWQSKKGFPETNLHMLESQLLCDVTFLVGEQRETIQAHKFILVSRSCVFETMFCGPMSETGSVEIPDADPDVFNKFLRYLYTGDVSLDPSTVLSVLYLAKKYCVTGLEKLCLDHCILALSPSNACTFLQQAFLFDDKDLKGKALDVIKMNPVECVSSKDFSNLGKECLDLILQEDEMRVDEIDLFKAVMTWAEEECQRQGREVTPTEKRTVLGKSLYLIRFPLVSQYNFSVSVCPAGVLTSDEVITLFRRYAILDLNVEPFITGQRTPLSYDLMRSILKPHNVKGTTRQDAIVLVPDKPVNLIGVYLYSGDLSTVQEVSVLVQILNEFSECIASDSTSVTVSPDMKAYCVSFSKPARLCANKAVTLKAKCSGQRRSQCWMNQLTTMIDAASGVSWTIKHAKGHTDCDDSLKYGHITGISYSVK